jgi:hypothetical protein
MLARRPVHISSKFRAMTVLILTIGLLNLALGLALGIFLGFGPPGLLATWDALGLHPAGSDAESLEDEDQLAGRGSEHGELAGIGMDPELVAAEANLVEELCRLRATLETDVRGMADPPDQPIAAKGLEDDLASHAMPSEHDDD